MCCRVLSNSSESLEEKWRSVLQMHLFLIDLKPLTPLASLFILVSRLFVWLVCFFFCFSCSGSGRFKSHLSQWSRKKFDISFQRSYHFCSALVWRLVDSQLIKAAVSQRPDLTARSDLAEWMNEWMKVTSCREFTILKKVSLMTEWLGYLLWQ